MPLCKRTLNLGNHESGNVSSLQAINLRVVACDQFVSAVTRETEDPLTILLRLKGTIQGFRKLEKL